MVDRHELAGEFLSDEAELYGEPASPVVFGIDQTVHVLKFGLNFHY